MATSMKKKHTVCFLSTYYRKYSQTQNKTIIMAISWFTLETASKIFLQPIQIYKYCILSTNISQTVFRDKLKTYLFDIT